jgi:multicomponent Na+:H+ antiporter subunit B
VRRHKREREAAIGMVFDQRRNRVIRIFRVFYTIVSVVCCAALIAILLTAVSYLPPVGSSDNPASNEVVEKYIEDGLQDTGAVNIVTGMILDYRAFDTFGESNVLFIATCTVLILLRVDKKKNLKLAAAEARREKYYEPKDDSILQKITFLLFPIIVIFGIYVILNGHISPGGGFSGGAIIGAGLILYANAFGFEKLGKFFTERTYKLVSFCSLTFYCLAKSYSFFTGANHLPSGIPLGNPGDILSSGLILPLNICVGLVVACTMYAFYTLFRKGGF